MKKYTLFVVETIRANGYDVLSEHGHFHLFDAVDEANEIPKEDRCCDLNDVIDDDFKGPCPGGCAVRSPRIVTFSAKRDKNA